MKRTEKIKCLKEFQRVLNDIKFPYEMKRGFNKYGKIYAFTNEESKYMIPETNEDKNAFMILSSGDQVFDAVLKGYKNIDTIDINEFSNYYALGLKKKAIELLPYQEFCQLFDPKNPANEHLLKGVLMNLESPYKEFWEMYYNVLKGVTHYSFSPLEFSQLYFMDSTYETGKKNTSYLADEESYNKLKENLKDANITFKQCDLSKDFKLKKKYDLIHFSNVLGYMNDNKSIELIEKIYNNNLNEDGSMIIVGYWDMLDKRTNLNNSSINIYNSSWGHATITKDNPMILERKMKDCE